MKDVGVVLYLFLFVVVIEDFDYFFYDLFVIKVEYIIDDFYLFWVDEIK